MFGRKQRRIVELESQLVQALALAEGCQKHPSYKAVRKPTANCAVCRDVFAQRIRLNNDGLAIRKGTRGPNKPKSSGSIKLSDQEMAELMVMTSNE